MKFTILKIKTSIYKIIFFIRMMPKALYYFFVYLFNFNIKIGAVYFIELLTNPHPGYSCFFIKNARKYIKNKNKIVTDKYKIPNEIVKADNSQKYIWVCWWDGKNKMPPVVKKCFEVLKKSISTNIHLILIDKYNYQNYIELPHYIINKLSKRKMTIQSFSDVLRWGLLAKYGGLWIDSTIFVTPQFKTHINTILSDTFITHKFMNQIDYKDEPSEGLWCNFFIGGNNSKTDFFNFVFESLLFYWKMHNKIIHYVYVDYIIYVGYAEIERYHKIISDVRPNKNDIWKLNRVMNSAFNQHTWNEMMKNSLFYKLTYKKKLMEIDQDGNITNYHKIML